jgi:hypothetical protein
MCEQFSEDESIAADCGEGEDMGHLNGQKMFMPSTS